EQDETPILSEGQEQILTSAPDSSTSSPRSGVMCMNLTAILQQSLAHILDQRQLTGLLQHKSVCNSGVRRPI
ncbi:hypothetical protein BGW39_000729, partial [Mortierella sp. 14UC]